MRPRNVFFLHVGVVALYLLGSLALWWKVWVAGNPAHITTCLCGDPSEEVWWLAWFPWAITHGHDPFFSNALYAGSGGVNLLANASIMVPALLLSPITFLFGPVAALNSGMLLAPVLSGWCMFLLARKVTMFVPGQVLAGALWGFSPFMIFYLHLEHLPHVLGFFAPLCALVVYDLLVEHKQAPWIDGLLLSILVILQFFTSTEMLAITMLAGSVGLLCALLLLRSEVRVRLRALVAVATLTLLGSVVVLAYPAWFAVAGPRHVTGLPWTQLPTQGTSISSVVNPGQLVHRTSTVYNLVGYAGVVGPSEAFLGWALIGVIAGSFPVWRHRKLAWCALVIGLISWSLSWGLQSHQWTPWRLFVHVPLVSDIQPARFAGLDAFGAAVPRCC